MHQTKKAPISRDRKTERAGDWKRDETLNTLRHANSFVSLPVSGSLTLRLSLLIGSFTVWSIYSLLEPFSGQFTFIISEIKVANERTGCFHVLSRGGRNVTMLSERCPTTSRVLPGTNTNATNVDSGESDVP